MPDAHTDAASPPQVDAASSMLDMQAFFPYRLAVLAMPYRARLPNFTPSASA